MANFKRASLVFCSLLALMPEFSSARSDDLYLEPGGKVTWVSMLDILAKSQALDGKIVSVPGYCTRFYGDGFFLTPSRDAADNIFIRDAIALTYSEENFGLPGDSRSDYEKKVRFFTNRFCEVLGRYTSKSVKVLGVPSRGTIEVISIRGGLGKPEMEKEPGFDPNKGTRSAN